MKKVFQLKAIAVFAVALLISTVACAQMNGKTIASPRDSVSGKVHGATISINYGAPSVRGRKIFGGLLPFGKTWRAGANEATTFTTNKDVKIGGKTLPAGKYSLFATPGEKEWKIIFNSQLGEWGIKRNGEANDDPAKDVVVVTVTPKMVPMTERLKYVITAKGFDLVWETTSVSVEVK
ncbi:DUF2911 domain-containing protein [Mucilaginibacter sp. UR6-11]|uniref:DUF2911 domain-containing protein n=1 Tax=Mucilaginibacter sp. UR6-11 TaxID=1435644 RepID=UPI001E622CE1|nr:DUF2911 domain-containing protein [Mucilaginibacter sp. UR6-11]MCC8425624.1 DUF2911 domain-containing protein [Mucilaginibacter sp. UR6-11]